MAGRRRADRAGRPKRRSPGAPTVARRETRRAFWALIATRRTSESAESEVGISTAVATRWFRQCGGMPPSYLGPSATPVSARYVSFVEREQLALLRVQGVGVRACARLLARAASTISRELRRNAVTRSGGFDYRALPAQWHAERAARRPRVAKLVAQPVLRAYVETRLAGLTSALRAGPIRGPSVRGTGRRPGRRQHRRWATAWSPAQIAHRLLLDFPDDPSMRISHEAICQAQYVQCRGALRRELTAYLRTGRPLRVPHARVRGRGK